MNNSTFSKKPGAQSTKVNKPEDVAWKVTLAQLQNELSEVAEREKNLAELQKQQNQESLQSQLTQGVQQLATLADCINALANQLEAD